MKYGGALLHFVGIFPDKFDHNRFGKNCNAIALDDDQIFVALFHGNKCTIVNTVTHSIISSAVIDLLSASSETKLSSKFRVRDVHKIVNSNNMLSLTYTRNKSQKIGFAVALINSHSLKMSIFRVMHEFDNNRLPFDILFTFSDVCTGCAILSTHFLSVYHEQLKPQLVKNKYQLEIPPLAQNERMVGTLCAVYKNPDQLLIILKDETKPTSTCTKDVFLWDAKNPRIFLAVTLLPDPLHGCPQRVWKWAYCNNSVTLIARVERNCARVVYDEVWKLEHEYQTGSFRWKKLPVYLSGWNIDRPYSDITSLVHSNAASPYISIIAMNVKRKQLYVGTARLGVSSLHYRSFQVLYKRYAEILKTLTVKQLQEIGLPEKYWFVSNEFTWTE